MQTETYEECFEDIKPLAAAARAEVGHGKLSKRLPDLNSEAYKKLAQSGAVLAITAREDKEMVGYCSVFLTSLLHDKTVKQGFCDSLYVKKEKRGPFSRTFIRAVKDIIKAKGAESLDFHVTAAVDFGRLLEAEGGELTSRTYTMELIHA